MQNEINWEKKPKKSTEAENLVSFVLKKWYNLS